MGGGPRAAILGSQVEPPRFGLIAAARRPADESSGRWRNGFTWEPERCSGGEALDPCASTEKTEGAGEETREYEPFLIMVEDSCSALGSAARDYEGRARRLLEACQSKILETEFWRGNLARASDWPNAYLASLESDVVTTGPSTPADALQCLEQALAECGCGARGMIHATRQVVTAWAELNLVRREGGSILTIHDTIVVPGAGYDGSGPQGAPDGLPVPAAGGSIWAYATSMVDVRLDPEVQVIAEKPQTLDRSVNTIRARAERYAAATFDGCCHAAAEIDLEVCAVGGPGS